MAKLTAIKIPNAKGGRSIAGYKISLPKVEMEKNGFKEGDELELQIKKKEVRIRLK